MKLTNSLSLMNKGYTILKNYDSSIKGTDAQSVGV